METIDPEKLSSKEKNDLKVKHQLGEAALRREKIIKSPEQFNLTDLDVRIAGELMLGLESEKIKNLIKKGYDKLLTDQEIDELLTVSNLVQHIMDQNDADLAIDEITAEQANWSQDIYIIDDFYNFRKRMLAKHFQFKQNLSSQQDYQTAWNELSHQSSYDKRQQLKACLKKWLVGFNRQIQELLNHPDELPTLDDVLNYINNASALIHLPEDRDKDGQLVFLNEVNSKFNQKKIESGLIGAINENCFRQLFELTNLGRSITHHSSTSVEDTKGIDCYLDVKYYINQNGRYCLATTEQIKTGEYQHILVPVDVKSSEKSASESFDKKQAQAKKHKVAKIDGYPIFSGVHREDLALYRDPTTGSVEMDSVHNIKTRLSSDLIAIMMKPIPDYIGYGDGYHPTDFRDRLDKLEADILQAVKYYDQVIE